MAGSTGAVLFSFVSSGPDVSGTGDLRFSPGGEDLTLSTSKASKPDIDMFHEESAELGGKNDVPLSHPLT